jgi:hypothetical protein
MLMTDTRHLNSQPIEDFITIEDLRRVVAEELGRALAGRHVEQDTVGPAQPDGDLETEYGEKLDRMLGGLREVGEDE